jgi:hypothetical protein
MDQSELAKRKTELIGQSQKEGVDWQGLIKDIPQDDDGLMSAALATRLGYNLKDVFNKSKTIADLEHGGAVVGEQRRKLRELIDKLK